MRGLLAIAVLGLMGPGPVTALAGDPAAGRAKAGTCAACHGRDGIGITPDYPNIAGQSYQYLVEALKAYRDGPRRDPLMKPIAEPQRDREIDDLAAFYSGLAVPRDPGPTASVGGDPGAGREKFGACACHGTDGIGTGPSYPHLKGQKETYLYESLRAYKSDARDRFLMGPMVASLNDQDLRDLAAYSASLR